MKIKTQEIFVTTFYYDKWCYAEQSRNVQIILIVRVYASYQNICFTNYDFGIFYENV